MANLKTAVLLAVLQPHLPIGVTVRCDNNARLFKHDILPEGLCEPTFEWCRQHVWLAERQAGLRSGTAYEVEFRFNEAHKLPTVTCYTCVEHDGGTLEELDVE